MGMSCCNRLCGLEEGEAGGEIYFVLVRLMLLKHKGGEAAEQVGEGDGECTGELALQETGEEGRETEDAAASSKNIKCGRSCPSSAAFNSTNFPALLTLSSEVQMYTCTSTTRYL